MAELYPQITKLPPGLRYDGWDGRRQSGGSVLITPGALTSYTDVTGSVLRYDTTTQDDTIPAGTPAVVWDTDPPTSDAADMQNFDLTSSPIRVFTVQGTGRLYAAPVGKWAAIAASFDAARMEYLPQAGFRRSQPRVTGVIPCYNQIQVATTICGNGFPGYSGDGGLAINATVRNPGAICRAPSGDLYFFDVGNGAIRKIEAGTGIITTVVSGLSGTGNNGLYLRYMMAPGSPTIPIDTLTVGGIDTDGTYLYYSDPGNHRVYRSNMDGSGATAIVGTGVGGVTVTGTGVAGTSCNVQYPQGVCLSLDRTSLFIAVGYNAIVLRLNLSNSMVTNVVGNQTVDTVNHTGYIRPDRVTVQGLNPLQVATRFDSQFAGVHSLAVRPATVVGQTAGSLVAGSLWMGSPLLGAICALRVYDGTYFMDGCFNFTQGYGYQIVGGGGGVSTTIGFSGEDDGLNIGNARGQINDAAAICFDGCNNIYWPSTRVSIPNPGRALRRDHNGELHTMISVMESDVSGLASSTITQVAVVYATTPTHKIFRIR